MLYFYRKSVKINKIIIYFRTILVILITPTQHVLVTLFFYSPRAALRLPEPSHRPQPGYPAEDEVFVRLQAVLSRYIQMENRHKFLIKKTHCYMTEIKPWSSQIYLPTSFNHTATFLKFQTRSNLGKENLEKLPAEKGRKLVLNKIIVKSELPRLLHIIQHCK